MDKIQYIECIGDTMNVDRSSALIKKLNADADKNFYRIADLDKHIEGILEEYKQQSGDADAYLWKSDNWGKPKQFFYWGIRRKENEKTYCLVDGRCEVRVIEIN